MIRPLRTLSASLALIAALAAPTRAQFGDVPKPDELVKITAAAVKAPAGRTAEAVITLRILEPWHVNSNPAGEDMIATTVTLQGAAGVTPRAAHYPPPRLVKLAFSDEPLAVWDGEVTIRVPLAIAANAPNGVHTLAGELMFQACNDNLCLAPATLRFTVTVGVAGGSSAAAPAADTGMVAAEPAPADTAAPSAGFTTAMPTGASAAPVVSNPLADRLGAGGWAGFLTIFLIGLALNLTPCVYPMLGVTVSIFGARRAAPPLQVFGMALLYVLGMALMYSVLGLVAAFTGGLFGSFLQSPVVLIAIGALMIGLALSMFGLYELQPPAWLLSKLGGNNTTSAVGVFLSGLVVGVFAAPCIGPPVVALLAVVGAKGDPWFGFTSFFTLAMGLGVPYLVLGTFSNLLQSMPRSGEWMIWVKKLFGVVLVGVGLFYALLALAPKYATWVIPVTLAAGGLYLGFFEKSAANRRGFAWLKRAVGVAGLAAAVWIFAGQQRAGIVFREYDATAVAGDLPRSKPVLLEFSADWCVPCHELEQITFVDGRVVAAARGFDAFHVDLTRYDSPESDAVRKQYGVRGVPTVVFLDASGREVPGTRVEGFLGPQPFLERMRLATAPAE